MNKHWDYLLFLLSFINVDLFINTRLFSSFQNFSHKWFVNNSKCDKNHVLNRYQNSSFEVQTICIFKNVPYLKKPTLKERQ